MEKDNITKEELDSQKFPYAKAYLIAQELVSLLGPYCSRIEIAGSIRRKKSYVKDIEIVVIAKPYAIGLLENGIALIVNKWKKVKGELPCKYTQRILPQGIKLDLFFATDENWGLILGIRTGSADYSHRVLACGWVRAGYKSVDGYLTRDGEQFEVKEERDLFRMIGIPYAEPEDRNL